MARKRTSFGNLAGDWTLSGIFAAATIWHRMSLVGAFALMSDAERRREATRMLAEKLAAGFEGGLDANVRVMQVMADAARGRIGTGDLLRAPADIASAGLQPALHRARANSRRLGRRSRRGKH
jgi:hypothetical protein